MAELHRRRDDTTPFVIQSEGRSSFLICGQLGVIRLKSSILRNIPLDIRYITLTIPPPFYIGSFRWLWYSLNGIESTEFPSTASEAIHIWHYLQLFGVDHDSEIVFKYLQGLNRMPIISESPDPLLSSIMTDMLKKIPKNMIPPPTQSKRTEVEVLIPNPRSMDDIPPLFESNNIDRLYVSLNPYNEITLPSMREILTEKVGYSSSAYVVLGMGTPNVRVWHGRHTGSGYAITLNNANITFFNPTWDNRRRWRVILEPRYGDNVDMEMYTGKIVEFLKTSDTEAVLEREYYPPWEVRLHHWVVPEGKTTYYIGKERSPIQGNIITMSDRSLVISSYYGDFQESSPGSGQREILGEDRAVSMNAFLYVWAYLNGQDNIAIRHSTSSSAIWYYIRYFGIPANSRFVDLFLMQIVNSERLEVLLPLLEEIPKTIPIFQSKDGKLSYIDHILNRRGDKR